MDVDLGSSGRPLREPAAGPVILLDTNAIIWLDQGHRRVRRLAARGHGVYVSPASLLELQFLEEAGRIRLRSSTLREVVRDARWVVDDPPAAAWFEQALELRWTRDPFDRLLVAHARLRGWRLATGDATLIEHLGADRCLPL
jgi:PIN domain nuclease of toxin-antitoxin system